MVFYKTSVLSNQDKERFHRVPIPRSTKTRPCLTKTKVCAAKAFSDSVFNQFQKDELRFCIFRRLLNQHQGVQPRPTKTKNGDRKTIKKKNPFVDRYNSVLLKDVVNSVMFSNETKQFDGVFQDTRFVKPRPRAIPSCSNSAFKQDEAVFNQDQDVCSDGVFQFRVQPRPSNVVCR